MRHLLFPGRCQPLPPPPTRLQRARAWAGRALASLRGQAAESWALVLRMPLVDDAAALAVLVAIYGLPTSSANGHGQPHLAFINLWIQLAIMVVAALVASAMAPKPPIPKPASLADFDVPTAEEGRKIAKVFGEYVIPDPNVLWYGDLTSVAIQKKGGKK